MSAVARPTLRVHPALPVAVIIGCAVGILVLLWPIHKAVGQVYALVAILTGFRYWPPMGRLFTRMAVPHRVVFVLLVGSMIAGHFSLSSYKYFPYVAWEIFPFAREDDPVTCREFLATTASGKTVRLLVEQLFPSIVQFNPPANNDGEAMTHLVHAMARIYNRGHTNDPVQRVDLVLYAVKLHPSESESRDLPSCELLKRYDISSALSN
jgi:hypothetical protein